MSTRILNGVLVPDDDHRDGGSAIIVFKPYGVPKVFGDAKGIELSACGPEGPFTAPPGKNVSLREIAVKDKDTFFGGSELDSFTINDSTPNEHHMIVNWGATNGGEIRELSFIGEAGKTPYALARG